MATRPQQANARVGSRGLQLICLGRRIIISALTAQSFSQGTLLPPPFLLSAVETGTVNIRRSDAKASSTLRITVTPGHAQPLHIQALVLFLVGPQGVRPQAGPVTAIGAWMTCGCTSRWWSLP
jgi:hypothetical protein